jgi:hypothetical protein
LHRGLGRITERAEHPRGFHQPIHEGQKLRDLVGAGKAQFAGGHRFNLRAPLSLSAPIVLPFEPPIPPVAAVVDGKRGLVHGARALVLAEALPDDPLHAYAVRIADFYAGVAPQIKERLEDLFGLSEYGVVSDRPKSRKSVYLKLHREVLEGAKIESIGEAIEAINDGYGIKLVCQDATRLGMLKLLVRFLKKLPAHDLRIVRLRHYTGPGVKPYLQRFWLKEFEGFLNDMNYQIQVVSGKGGIKNSGFTSFQLDLELDVFRGAARYPVKVDMHFRGSHVDRINDTEHLMLSILRQGRSLDEALLSYSPLKEVVDYLHVFSDEETYALDNYMLNLYRSARQAELDGERFWSPNMVEFPNDYLDSILRFDHVETVYKEAKQRAYARQLSR